MDDSPSRRLRFLPYWRFTMLLPTAYNVDDPVSPGGPIDGSIFLDVEDRLLARFGGFTKLTAAGVPVVEGQWRDPVTGLLYADRHRRYEIVTARRRADGEFLLALHDELLVTFRQEAIFLTREALYIAAAEEG